MSTKIYSGYKLAPEISLFEFQRSFASLVKNEYQAKAVNEVLQQTLYYFDQINMGNRKLMNTIKRGIFDRPRNEHQKMPVDRGERLRRVLDYVITDFVMGDTIRARKAGKQSEKPETYGEAVILFNKTLGETYFIFFGDSNLEEKVGELPGVSYFGYWNNSDRPDDVSKKEWKYRRDAWEGVGDLGQPISSLGLIVNPLTDYERHRISAKEFVNYIKAHPERVQVPTVENRVKTAIRDAAFAQTSKDVKAGKINMYDFFAHAAELQREASFVKPVRDKAEKYIQGITLDDLKALGKISSSDI